MLELIHDNRTGKKLEIVIPTFNEEHRLRTITSYYGSRFDIVLLDGGSSDNTVSDAIQAGVTVFRRTVAFAGQEMHFANYVNQVTKSGFCFWMMADEFIQKDDLIAIEQLLRENSSAVMCRRRNWFFCRLMHTYVSQSPRAVCRGGITYDPRDLHASLKTVGLPGKSIASSVFDVNHLHVYSAKSYFGTAGAYAYEEVAQMRRSPRSGWRFFRRYVATLIAFVLWKWWREKDASPAILVTGAAQNIAIFWLATLAWIEQSFLLTAEQQQEEYDQIFRQAQGDKFLIVSPQADHKKHELPL